MTVELERLQAEIEAQLVAVADALQVSREDVRRDTETIRLAMHEALLRHSLGEPGQLEHLKMLAKEIPSVLAIPTLQIEAQAKQRVFRVITVAIEGFFSIAARALAPLLLLGLLVLPGCAWMVSSTKVQAPLIVGLADNLCGVVDECIAAGRLAADVPACQDGPGTFWAEAHGKRVAGELVASGGAEVCIAVESCLAAWPDVPANFAADYRRWCGRLQGVAAASLN